MNFNGRGSERDRRRGKPHRSAPFGVHGEYQLTLSCINTTPTIQLTLCLDDNVHQVLLDTRMGQRCINLFITVSPPASLRTISLRVKEEVRFDWDKLRECLL